MAESMVAPWEFVNLLCKPGLETIAGRVELRQYLSGNKYNGGNDSAVSLYKNLRWYRDGEGGAKLNDLLGTSAIDLALKGQGAPSTFVGIWNFMIRNREKMKKLHIDVFARRSRSDVNAKIKTGSGTVYDLFFKGRSDREAIQKMVDERFFGIDCIGFVGNFLIWSREWSKYHNVGIDQYAKKSCKIPVKSAEDVRVLDFLIWDGHIALVDFVRFQESDKVVIIDVCQSTAGGPQCNEFVRLQQLGSSGPGGHRQFKVGGGSPRMPVDGTVYLQRRDGWFY